MTADTVDFTFDPFAPGPRETRPEVFAELRERAPIFHTASNIWVVSRFEDVRTVNATPELFSSRPNPYDGGGSSHSAAPAEADPELIERFLAIAASMPVDLGELTAARSLVAADPPEHTRMRRIVSRGFTPGRIAQWSARIEELVDDCLGGADDLDGFDVVEQLAIPLPVKMISDILGIGPAHYPQVKEWSDRFAGGVGDDRNTPEGQVAVLETLKDFSTFFAPLIEERRTDPRDDVISAMVRAVDDDTLSTAETLMMVIIMMVAGNETSTNLIGNTVVELLANRDQLQRVIEEPALLESAIDEANRLTAPIQFTFREVREDTELNGTALPKDAIIALHIAAANRDPRQFDDPDRFLIDRPRTKSLAFGHGVHYCLGAHLAMQEVSAAVGRVLPHLPHLELSDQPLEPNPSSLLNGWRNVVLARA